MSKCSFISRFRAIMNKEFQYIQGQLFKAVANKVTESVKVSSKVDKSRFTYKHVNLLHIPMKGPIQNRSMLSFIVTKFFDSPALCKEQRKIRRLRLFEIQILGLERDRPLLTEALWKQF